MSFGNNEPEEKWHKKVDWKTAFAGAFLGSVFSMVTFNLFQRTIVKDEIITTLAKYSDEDEELGRAVKNRICELRSEAGQGV